MGVVSWVAGERNLSMASPNGLIKLIMDCEILLTIIYRRTIINYCTINCYPKEEGRVRKPFEDWLIDIKP